jgi:formate hydrogenlyase subunit 6/NADH:ubiquinone oxidoreductase subunit I
LSGDHAKIDQSRCSHCRFCIDACPQGAIVDLAPVANADLANTIVLLQRRTEDLAVRIETLKQNKYK